MANSLGGTLTMQTVPQQLLAAESTIADDCLNLAGVGQCDSAGIAFLLEMSRRWQAKGRKLRFTGASPQVLQLARFFELDEALGLDGST